MNKRRNLTGIYIFDKFPEDEKKLPTCLEDCQKETRQKWLREQLDDEGRIECIEILCGVLRDISDQFNIIGQ